MAELTNIEWCDSTWNPWIGCTKISPGCQNCYAESLSKRYGKDVWGKGKERSRTSKDYWLNPIKWDRKAAKTSIRSKVFCASMADVFDPEAPPEWRGDLFKLIEATPNLWWLLLTKRPESVIEMIGGHALPLNVWLGTSVEDQARADLRIPALLKVTATVRFLSVEPLLESVDLGNLAGIHWVIVGGESGPRCRPMSVEWARNIRDQCQAAGTAYFCKQLGGHPDKRHTLEDFPEDLRLREMPSH